MIIKCIENKDIKNQIFNVGSGKPVKIKKIINTIRKIVKKGHPEYGQIPLRKDEPINLYPDIKLSSKLLNWKPKVSLLNGLKKTIKFYKNLNDYNQKFVF